MGKKMIAFIMVVGLVVMGLVAVAIPKGVQADRIYPTDWEWSGAAFIGYDSFYGTDVVAYQEGDTAHLTAQVYNQWWSNPGDATIQSAVVKFDWGEEYAASNVPAEIGQDEYATLEFEFTVPTVDVASNAILHDYEIIVTYQTQGVGYVENQVNWQFLFNGNGFIDSASLSAPVVADSVAIYSVDSTATPPTIYEMVLGTDYTLDAYDGDLSFTPAPLAGRQIRASYVYMSELSGTTDGFNTNFRTDESPIVADSERIFIVNTVTEADPGETTDYTIDYETGKVALGTAPQSYEEVWGTWEYYQDSTDWGLTLGDDNFAVYSAGQADARQLRDLYNDMDRPSNLVTAILEGSATGSQAELEAEALATLGNTEYDKGSFEAAADYYQQAIDKMNEAIAADTEIGIGAEEILGGIGTGAGDWLDGQAAKGQAQAEKMKAEAGFADMYGIFIIMAGAGVILVSAGFIIWGVSRLVAARRM